MGNRPSSTENVAAIGNQTSSTHSSVVSSGVHLFRIKRHSAIAGSDEPIPSRPCGYEWTIHYYPNGADVEAGGEQHVSVFLVLNNPGDGTVTASYSFSCLRDPASPAAAQEEKKKVSDTRNFSSTKSAWGSVKFMSKADLAASGCIKDDCLVIKCTVEVISKELTDDDQDSTVVVPPSELSRHLGSLLESGHGADITLQIGKTTKKFRAHRCVLAARSPVFRARLCGSTNNLCIKDMDADVLEVLLHYMYHDDLPMPLRDARTQEAIRMAQQVIIAAGADRYGMERLRLMCESKLSKMLDVDTVCSILNFADEHNCRQLKDCCLEYMSKDLVRLKAIGNTEGFRKLNKNCLSIACGMLLKAL